MHSVTRMMDRHPELKFTCSSSALYRWIEETDPALFRRIALLIEAGRWEPIGGWEVQSDAILAGTESLIRQGLSGRDYFRRKFGIEITTGYCVDSFGHSAGLPKILRSTGFTHYVFLRPMTHQAELPLLFNWQSDDGSSVSALRIFDTYNLENVSKDDYLRRIEEHIESGLDHQTLFFGVGDHGGGIYEKHLDWLREASEKHEIIFSTLQEYFDAVKTLPLPVIKGELGPVFRGCYSACHEVKRQVSHAVRRMRTAEKTGVSEIELNEAWYELLFHHFHDILPGTSTREAYQMDIFPGLGAVTHAADTVIDREMCRHAAAEDTSFMQEGGVYLWNPDPFAKNAIVSIPAFADPNETGKLFNVLQDKDGNQQPLQILPAPSMFGPCGTAWGNLTAVIEMPPCGTLSMAYIARGKQQEKNVGFETQNRLLKQLSFLLFHDDSGTWGFTMKEFIHPEQKAELVRTDMYIDGPVCSVLRAVYRIRNSELQVDLYQYAGIEEIKIALRIDWHEKQACLKLVVEHGLDNYFFATGTAGGTVKRMSGLGEIPPFSFVDGKMVPFHPNSGECSMVEWSAVLSSAGNVAFFVPDLYACDHADGMLRITLIRTTLYADHHPFPHNKQTGYMDMGMTFLELWYSNDSAISVENLPLRARKRLDNVEVLEVTGHAAGIKHNKKRDVCHFVLEHDQVTIEAFYRNARGKWEIHLLNHGDAIHLKLPDGRSINLPAHAIKLIELNAMGVRQRKQLSFYSFGAGGGMELDCPDSRDYTQLRPRSSHYRGQRFGTRRSPAAELADQRPGGTERCYGFSFLCVNLVRRLCAR
jgi:alpha-mannosidase